MQLTPEQIARFWTKVDKSGECWLWTGARKHGNYGHLSLNGRFVGAHRVAYFLVHGIDPQALAVCHHCDNPPCVRPDHLFLGTIRDNHQDMIQKGRQALPPRRAGEANGQARLTADDIKQIRALYAAGDRQKSIARRFGISRSQVGNIVRGECWRDNEANVESWEVEDGQIVSAA